MTAFLRVAWLVVRKYLTVEIRSFEILSTTLVFAATVVLVFSFGLVKEGQPPDDVAAAILWIAIAFAGTLALARVFETVATDPARLCIGGFSDGATYAVSLGLINGDLFPRVAAFSPGFVIPGATHGKPRFFVSHGSADKILPIDRCSRVIVSRLQTRGYDVTFREFDGGHDIPPAIAREGMTWIAASGS